MKVLFLDFLYPKGHIRQNHAYINLLSEISEVFVFSPEGRYHNLNNKVEIIINNSLKISNGKLLSRLSSLKIMLLSAIIAYKVKPDYIFIASFDTIMFSIGRLFFPKGKKIFLLHHNNTDELDNRIKYWFFKRYMKKVEHIVFEEFIKEHLIKQFELSQNTIHILPHQLNQNEYVPHSKKYSCVGLSSSNNEELISEIIDIEKRNNLLKESGHKVILKSQISEFDNGFLKVVKGYIDDDNYNEYINHSLCIYMPFPDTFRYRMSGTLADAFSNNKILLGNNIPLIRYYVSEYGNVCKIVNNAKEFLEYVINMDGDIKDYQIMEFQRFKILHSPEKIKEALNNILTITND